MSPRHLRHGYAGRSGLPADRALLLATPVAIPAPTQYRSGQQSVHQLQWTPSPTSAFMINVEARSARAGRPDAHDPVNTQLTQLRRFGDVQPGHLSGPRPVRWMSRAALRELKR